MTETTVVTRNDRDETRSAASVSGIAVLALVSSGLFGGRVQRDATLLTRLSRPMQPATAMVYRQAA